MPVISDAIEGCACDIWMEPFGTAQTVAVRFSNPVPIAREGYTVVSYDGYPKVPESQTEPAAVYSITRTGENNLGVQFTDTLYSYTADKPNAYFGYNCFDTPVYAQVVYGKWAECTISVAVVFSDITVADAEGNVYSFANVNVEVTSTSSRYVQHPETGGWGSEKQLNLFIPWENLR